MKNKRQPLVDTPRMNALLPSFVVQRQYTQWHHTVLLLLFSLLIVLVALLVSVQMVPAAVTQI